jgi:hypothetical protein
VGRPGGLTLMEILITIVLVTTVLISFAMVYPFGYRLRQKAFRGTQAANVAAAVAEEVRNLPMTNADLDLADLASADNYWRPGKYPGFPATDMQGQYTIEAGDIFVYLYTQPQPNNLGDKPTFANIQVTVTWYETLPGAQELQKKKVTVMTAKTANRP